MARSISVNVVCSSRHCVNTPIPEMRTKKPCIFYNFIFPISFLPHTKMAQIAHVFWRTSQKKNKKRKSFLTLSHLTCCLCLYQYLMYKDRGAEHRACAYVYIYLLSLVIIFIAFLFFILLSYHIQFKRKIPCGCHVRIGWFHDLCGRYEVIGLVDDFGFWRTCS